MGEPRARFDHWFWTLTSPLVGKLGNWMWRQQMRTDAASTQYRRIHKTRAADGYYHVKDGIMRLWMSTEEYERISERHKDAA